MKKWITFIVLLVVLAFVATASTYYFLLNKNKSNRISADSQILPKELTDNFDATVTAPKFKIMGSNLEAKTLDLTFVFPVKNDGQKVTSTITCGDIIVNGERQSLENTFKIIAETDEQNMIFSGLCSDNFCNEIKSACDLHVSK